MKERIVVIEGSDWLVAGTQVYPWEVAQKKMRRQQRNWWNFHDNLKTNEVYFGKDSDGDWYVINRDKCGVATKKVGKTK